MEMREVPGMGNAKSQSGVKSKGIKKEMLVSLIDFQDPQALRSTWRVTGMCPASVRKMRQKRAF